MQVSDVMTRDVAVVSPYANVLQAAQKMDWLNVGALPVCDGDRLVGIVTDRDITVRCTAAGESPESARVHEVMTDDVCWCFDDDPVEQVEEEMAYLQIRRLPVAQRRGHAARHFRTLGAGPQRRPDPAPAPAFP